MDRQSFVTAMNFIAITFVVGMLSTAASVQEQEFTPPYHYWQQQPNQQLTTDLRRQQTANPRQSLLDLLAAFGISPSQLVLTGATVSEISNFVFRMYCSRVYEKYLV